MSGELDAAAVEWLLTSDEPGILTQVRRDLLADEVHFDTDVLRGPLVSRLLAGQEPDGGFGVRPYQKWLGVHWRLVSLVELGATAEMRPVMAALENVLEWMAADGGPGDELIIRGLPRVHASIYANALAVACRLGKASDARARDICAWLIHWQWPDGGWNCDRRRDVTHSSFYESITPLWALGEYAGATGDSAAREARDRAAEFFLAHRVYLSHSSDTPGDPKWLKLRYPEYWHFDYLHGLVMLARAGALPDPRAADALRLLRDQQQPDGRWVPSGPQYWKGRSGLYGDAAGWSASSVSQMLTLNALRVLKTVGG
jgi:hypothetical protein